MKKRIICLLLTLSLLFSLCSCTSKDVVEEAEATSKITQSSVIKVNRLNENNNYSTFLKDFNESYLIPGLLEGVIPQGICYDETTGYLLISGYYEDGTFPSVIMVINESDGTFVNAYSLKTLEGKDYYGHVGGIASSKNTVYVVSDSECYTFPADELLKTVNTDYIQFHGHFKLNTKGSFACYYNETLWFGDFVESNEKALKDIHDITTLENGETFYAYCEGYLLTDGLPRVEKTNSDSSGYVPDYMLAIPQQVQGMAFTKTGKIIFSTSFGRKNDSKLYVFNDMLTGDSHGTKLIDGQEVEFYACSSEYFSNEIIAPPMSEGLANAPDRIYLAFESGATKYRCDGGKFPTETLFSTTME